MGLQENANNHSARVYVISEAVRENSIKWSVFYNPFFQYDGRRVRELSTRVAFLGYVA